MWPYSYTSPTCLPYFAGSHTLGHLKFQDAEVEQKDNFVKKVSEEACRSQTCSNFTMGSVLHDKN